MNIIKKLRNRILWLDLSTMYPRRQRKEDEETDAG